MCRDVLGFTRTVCSGCETAKKAESQAVAVILVEGDMPTSKRKAARRGLLRSKRRHVEQQLTDVMKWESVRDLGLSRARKVV